MIVVRIAAQQSCALPRYAKQFNTSPHARPRARNQRATHTQRGHVSQKAITAQRCRLALPSPGRRLAATVHLLPYPRSAAPRRCCNLLQRWRSRGSRSLSFVLDDARFDAADVAHVAPRLPRFTAGSGRETARTRVEPLRGFPGDHTPKPLPGEHASLLSNPPRPWKP